MAHIALITAYNDKGELLLGRRNDNKNYTLPGGSFEDGEVAIEAARRELKEETGLDAHTLTHLKTYTNPDDGNVLHCFSAYVHGEPTGKNDPDQECNRWVWVDVSDGVPKNIYNHLHGPQDENVNLVKQLFDLKKSEQYFEPLMKAHDDEVTRLLHHPDPHERTMALKQANVHPKHLQVAVLDHNPDVHVAALSHPFMDGGIGLHLMESDHDLAGRHPTAQQKLFLASPQATAKHLKAAHENAQRNPEATHDLHGIIATHPAADVGVLHDLYHDPATKDEHRAQVLGHKNVSPAVLESAVRHALLSGKTDHAKLALQHPHISRELVEELLERVHDKTVPNHVHDLAVHALQHSKVSPETVKKILGTKFPKNPRHHELAAAAASRADASEHHVDHAVQSTDPAVWKNLHGAQLSPAHVTHLLHRLLAEAPRDDGALKRLADHPNFGPEHLEAIHSTPLEKAEGLAKAVSEQHFKGIVRALDSKGPSVVDHKPDLIAHPASVAPHAEAYKAQVLDNPHKTQRLKGSPGGVSKKALFHYNVPGTDVPAKAIVKPYHERVIKRIGRIGRIMYPEHAHQGWAEMTSQALYHSAGIGALHQKVHVAEPPMGAGHDQEPALVVHVEPGMESVRDAYDPRLAGHPYSVDPAESGGVHDDVRKIALMDFLSNNKERHPGNLMRDQAGHRVLAIDNSRSFQYKKGGAFDEDTEGEDTFGAYHEGSALDNVSPFLNHNAKTHYDQGRDAADAYAPIFEWWGKHSPDVRRTMNKRLEQIKDPTIRDHIKRNFDTRADWLDDHAKHGLDNYSEDWAHDTVPIYKPGELTDHEKRNQRSTG